MLSIYTPLLLYRHLSIPLKLDRYLATRHVNDVSLKRALGPILSLIFVLQHTNASSPPPLVLPRNVYIHLNTNFPPGFAEKVEREHPQVLSRKS